jgi:hypothetical protein
LDTLFEQFHKPRLPPNKIGSQPKKKGCFLYPLFTDFLLSVYRKFTKSSIRQIIKS